MPWALILDCLLAVLLLLMIGYAFVLNRRLSTLRTDREDLEAFITRFNEATNKANASLQGLRAAADSNAATIKAAADKAQALRDELAFLVERADGSADRLAEERSETTDAAREASKSGAKPAGRRKADTASEGEAASDAERELMNALRRAR
jgi:septal ring factor EnvC (AmiA/AmiB activator)